MSDNYFGGVKAGATSVSIDILLRKTADNTEKTGLIHSTAGNIASYRRQGGARVAITLVTLATPSTAWSSGGFVELDATNMPGAYRFDVPDAAFAAGVDYVDVFFVSTGQYGYMERIALSSQVLQTGDVYGLLTAPAGAQLAKAGGPLWVGTATTVTTTQLTLPGGHGLDASADIAVVFLSGTAANGKARYLLNVSANVWAFDPALAVAPSGTVVCEIIPAPATPIATMPTVLLSAGTGTGQLDVTAGVVKGDVTKLLGTAWLAPATAGTPDMNAKLIGGTVQTGLDLGANITSLVNRIGAFTGSGVNTVLGFLRALKRKDLAAPSDVGGNYDPATDSVEALRDNVGTAGAGLTAVGDTAGITTLLARLSAARAGYLDNLNVGGLVASSAEASSIQNNTRTVIVVPEVIERPDSGTIPLIIHMYLYDSVGNMEAPDSVPTLALVNQAGTDLSARLGSVNGTLVGTGHYKWTYTASVGDTLEQLLWEFSVVEGGATRLFGRGSIIVDTTAVDFTSSDRTTLNGLVAGIAAQITTDHGGGSYVRNTEPLDALATRTALGLAAANMDAQFSAILTVVNSILALVDTEIAAIKAKTDQLPSTDAVTAIVAAIFARQFGANYQSRTFSRLIEAIVAAAMGPTSGAGTTSERFNDPTGGGRSHTVTNNGVERTVTDIAA